MSHISAKSVTWELRLRDGDDCFFCGCPIDFDEDWKSQNDPRSPTVEHLLAVNDGTTGRQEPFGWVTFFVAACSADA